MKIAACPCGSKRHYADCCQPVHHSDGRAAGSAEALMRSRYSAFVLGLDEYLLASWHPTTRPARLATAADQRRWLGLKVISHVQPDSNTATVEFVARSRIAGQRADRQHEVSRFLFENGQWFYLDGKTD